jgi:hypothetical protein
MPTENSQRIAPAESMFSSLGEPHPNLPETALRFLPVCEEATFRET